MRKLEYEGYKVATGEIGSGGTSGSGEAGDRPEPKDERNRSGSVAGVYKEGVTVEFSWAQVGLGILLFIQIVLLTLILRVLAK